MLITLQIYDDFGKAIMHCDVISYIIYTSNKVEYLETRVREIQPRKLYCHFSLSLQYNQQIQSAIINYAVKIHCVCESLFRFKS